MNTTVIGPKSTGQYLADERNAPYLPNKYGTNAGQALCPACNRDMLVEIFDRRLAMACTYCDYWYVLGKDAEHNSFGKENVGLSTNRSRRTNKLKSRGYRVLPHTADVGIEGYGGNLSEAFEEAAKGMFSVITDLRKVRVKTRIELRVSSMDLSLLLVAWLNELIFTFETKGLLFKRFNVKKLDGASLEADCYGEEMERERHRIKSGIKAVTHHMVSIQEEPVARVRVYVDI